MSTSADDYDRLRELKDFEDSKIGVRGLVESGAATIPRFFHHPPENLTSARPSTALSVPTVDISHLNTDLRSTVVREIADAARTWGFLQITNHGIPQSVVDATIAAVRSFNEQPMAVRSQHYCREGQRCVEYNTNYDLFRSKAASWRDTIQVRVGNERFEAEMIPEICRREVVAWDDAARKVAKAVMEALSEGLELERGKLEEMSCLEGRSVAAHYYPYCPEAVRTVGTTAHSDPSVLTVLVQNEIKGLEVKHGDEWVEVVPTCGALVVNVGDLLQIMSNDEYKSVEHRVVANPLEEPRISIAVFFTPSKKSGMAHRTYGPLSELLTKDKPAHYRNFTMLEFLSKFFSKELEGGLTNCFKL